MEANNWNITLEAEGNQKSCKTTLSSMNKVLLIEDNPGDARLVEILLSESDLLDCEIMTRVTLAAGFEELKSEKEFAAVLLDLTLPDSQGFDTLKKLLDEFPQVNVIVLTGMSDKRLGLKAVKAGAQDFLVKGNFDSDILAKSLRYSIERSKGKKRLEETQRIAHIGNWECRPAARKFYASAEVYRIFGFEEKTIFTYEELQNSECPCHVLEELNREVLVRKEFKKDIEVRQLTGGKRYVSIQCVIHGNSIQDPIIQGIIQDITERKKAEQELLKSQERYQEIFTQSQDAVFICTMEGKLIDFNPATTKLFGYTRKEVLQFENIHQLYYPPEKKDAFLQQLKSRKSIKDFPLKIAQKGGEARECLVNANILVTDGFTGYNCIIRDITERIQAEKLRKARDLARQSAKMKEQFVASISHEMRTPMNAILGMSNLLIDMDLSPVQKELVSSVRQSSEVLLGVVNDILEISSIQNGKIVFENKTFDLHELLKNLVNVMQYKAQEKDLFFEIIMDDNLPILLKGDKLRLNQILYNLVGNAIKFTEEGFVKIHVRKQQDTADGVLLEFIVEDSGIGIPEGKVQAVFETFTRIKQKDKIFEGTGLGLAISKNLVEQQGGKIWATSELGKGSKFIFDLTFEIGTELEDVPAASEQIALIDENATFRLLLAEDHKINQLVARKTLERKWKNIDLTIAENGKMAIDLLKEKTFDIILMDIQMPVMDGYEATKYIRQHMPPEVANLPILAMTAHVHISKDKKFKEYGMNDFVLKPFEPNDLFSKISKYIQKKYSDE